MLTSDYNSWDKGIFNVVGKPGGPTLEEFIKPKYFYRRDNEANAKFDEYGPTDITYKFNKFGFRSDEFVDDGRDSILSVGDSFTVCIGVPYEHSWPYILSKKFDDCKNYNLGLSAVSGDYVVRAVSKTIEILKPKAVFVFWPGLAAREIAIRKRYLPFKIANVLGEEQVNEPVFDGLSKFVHDNSYILYQHKKNVEMLHAICKVRNVPCHELSVCTYNQDIETINIADSEKDFDMSRPSEIQNPPGYEKGFTRTTRDGVHLGHEWNKHIAELFYSQYKYNI